MYDVKTEILWNYFILQEKTANLLEKRQKHVILFFPITVLRPSCWIFFCFLLDFLTDTYGNIMCTLNEDYICIYFIILFFHLSTKQ